LLDFAGPVAEIGSLMAPGAPCGQLLAAAFDQVDLLDLVQRKGTDAQFIKMAASGRNALDFHIAGYLGKLATEEPDSYFHVIAKDTGLDPLLNHMREKVELSASWNFRSHSSRSQPPESCMSSPCPGQSRRARS
jgi:hypothetical protein